MNKLNTSDPSLVRSHQTSQCAFAISRHGAELHSHEIDDGVVFFILRLPKGTSFQAIQDDYDSDGFTSARSFSNELSRLKSIVLRSRTGGRL